MRNTTDKVDVVNFLDFMYQVWIVLVPSYGLHVLVKLPECWRSFLSVDTDSSVLAQQNLDCVNFHVFPGL